MLRALYQLEYYALVKNILTFFTTEWNKKDLETPGFKEKHKFYLKNRWDLKASGPKLLKQEEKKETGTSGQ